MKKILALLLALAMLVSVTPVFAEETTEEIFTPSVENYEAIGNATKVTTAWKVSGGEPSPASGNFYSTKFTSGNIVVYKIALPAPGNGQTYDKFVVRFGVGSNNGGAAYKMPGEDWDMTQSLIGTEWYATLKDSSKAATLKAYEGSVLYGPESSGYKNAYADITEYAKECWYAGQNYMYLAVGCQGSTSSACMPTVSDSSYVKFAPTTLHSFKAVEAPVALENTAEAMKALGNETIIPAANGYKATAGEVSAASGNWTSTYFSGRGNMAIVKVDLPEIPAGKTLGNFVFRYGVASSYNKDTGIYSMASNLRVFKMPGTDWTLSGSIADTDWYKKIIVASTSTAYNANDNSIVYTVADTGSDAYTIAYANITSYIKECYANGQTYCYLAYGDWNSTRNTGSTSTTDSSYTGAGVKPRIYYSFTDIGALELLSSTPANGEITAANEAVFTFNNKLASATATVNGVEYPCELNGSQVKVTFADAGAYTVQVTVKDIARNTVTTDAVKFRAGYNSQYLDNNAGNASQSYVVSNTGVSSATYNPRVNDGDSTVLKIKLPTVEEGKTFGQFGIRYISSAANLPYIRLFKIPHDGTGYPDNLIQTSGEAAEGLINIYNYKQGSNGEYKANTGESVFEGQNASGDAYAYADLTTYAKECIERGQTHMLIGFTASDARSMVGIGDGDLDKAQRYHYIYWTTEDADLTAKAPKFVASSDANTFVAATGLTALAKATEYKFITSLANFGAEDASVTLYVAQYADGELIGITPKTVTVTANGTAADFTSASFTVDSLTENVKAFIWNEAEQKPMLIGDVIVEAK